MMRVPGSNVLNKAFTVLAKSNLIYYKAVGRTLNSVNQWVVQYDAGTPIKGSFQPVPREKYDKLGLEFAKSYYYFYISKALIDLRRDIPADQISFQGTLYQIQSNTEWLGVDGWVEALCVAIGLDTNISAFGFGSNNQNFGNGGFFPEEIPPDAR
jgi:hypothetical protein